MIDEPSSCKAPMCSPNTDHDASITATNTSALVVNAAESVDLRRIVIQAKKRFHLEKFEITGRDPESQQRSGRPEATAEEAS